MLNPLFEKWSLDHSEDKLLILFLGTNTDVKKIISKLETAYGTVVGYDVLMQQFYGVHMDRSKKSSKLCHQNRRIFKSDLSEIS